MMTPPMRPRMRILFVLMAISSAGIAGALYWAGARQPTLEQCAVIDTRLGNLVEGPDSYVAEARYQRWGEGEHCSAKVSIAIFAPGDTWEDEGQEPAAVMESSLPPDVPYEGSELRWEDNEIRLSGRLRIGVRVDRLPDADDPGAFTLLQGSEAEPQ